MTAVSTERVSHPEGTTHRKSFVLLASAILALTVGFGSVAGGIFGAWYTWEQASVQNIVTPDDAAIAETPVRGPFTMWAQADIITQHQLDRTDGLYYAEMPRMVPQVDEAGEAVVDEAGEAVMVPNEARASWFEATTLTTSLSLGIISYALATMAIAVGLTLATMGFVFLQIRKRAVLL